MRRDDLWEDAAAFRPERWLGYGPPSAAAWIPFVVAFAAAPVASFAEMEMREVLCAAAGR